ncbi:hypothetical protein [Thermoanaerobacterium sp. RBIITD]|uniref:tetratricopeptide repeat protein n=1 Tax=Thermoanaerobacterium sp. RBIITD TaxID=1550240 RepID=UPI000BC0C0BF|nr:hypothetical protein [Thermoanaerobacterium sp. RBIITD]SNX55038.1 Tetratricopeptide repeat-containing protein [Thermoanaerobacterium sp. RBIITD]
MKYKKVVIGLIFAVVLVITIIEVRYNFLNHKTYKPVINKNITTEEKTKNTKNVVQKQENKPSIAKQQDNKSKELEDKFQQSFLLFRQKKYVDSINLAEEIIKEDANFYEAYTIKGLALSYNGNFQEGMKNIDKALEINPNYGLARYSKALSYELYGYYDDALKWYNKDLEVENYVWTYYGMSSIYGRRGDIENTVKYLKIAINMEPNIKNLAKDEKDFNPVKQSKEFQDLLK